MVLEAQGFYHRPLFCSRATTAWLLFKGCALIGLGIIFTLFLFQIDIARSVIIWFAGISFGLVFFKEELLLLGLKQSGRMPP